MDEDPPGLDARHVYLRLTQLRERAAALEEEAKETQKEDSSAETSSSQTSITQTNPSHWSLPFASWVPSFSGLRNKEASSETTVDNVPVSLPCF